MTAAAYWTYPDLAREFEISIDSVKRRMPQWQAQKFPAPLPWSGRPLRWDPDAVRGWKRRREIACEARPRELVLLQGGA